MKNKILLFCVITILSPNAFANNGSYGFALSGAFNFFNTNRESSVRTNFEDTDLFADLKFGYSWYDGLYLGGIYTSFKDSDENRSGFGVSVGYTWYNFFVGASYLLQLEHEIQSESQTLKGGSGLVFEGSYNYPLTPNFKLGMVLSYYDLSYKDTENNAGVTSSISNHSESFMIPQIQLSLSFGGSDGSGGSYDF